MEKIRKSRRILWNIAWFLIIFNVLSIPMYVVIWLNLSFSHLQSLVTYITYLAFKGMGYAVALEDYTLFFSSDNQMNIFYISWDSTGWKSLYALTALVLATPLSTIRKKLKFLSIGLPVLLGLNLLRIVANILIGLKYGQAIFDLFHLYLWREGLIFSVVAIWLVWLWPLTKKINYNIGKIKTVI